MKPHVAALTTQVTHPEPNRTRLTCTGSLRASQQGSYVHVPFDVPADAIRCDVEYAYSARIGAEPHLTGGNTIDLGVMDPRGIAFLTAGLRGWSGSERATFFIAEDAATPGYVARPLPPGRWHVLLGLYKVAPAGCEYRVTITIATEAGRQTHGTPRIASRRPRRCVPSRDSRPPRWIGLARTLWMQCWRPVCPEARGTRCCRPMSEKDSAPQSGATSSG